MNEMYVFNMVSVKVYSTTWCPYCKQAKDFLKANKIHFEDINVQEDPDKAKEMIQKSGQTGVPVIDIDGRIIIGFDRPKMKATLGLK